MIENSGGKADSSTETKQTEKLSSQLCARATNEIKGFNNARHKIAERVRLGIFCGRRWIRQRLFKNASPSGGGDLLLLPGEPRIALFLGFSNVRVRRRKTAPIEQWIILSLWVRDAFQPNQPLWAHIVPYNGLRVGVPRLLDPELGVVSRVVKHDGSIGIPPQLVQGLFWHAALLPHHPWADVLDSGDIDEAHVEKVEPRRQKNVFVVNEVR
jgi:hypothetical protein